MANQNTTTIDNSNEIQTRNLWQSVTAPIRTTALCLETVTSSVATTAIVLQHATNTAARWAHGQLEETEKTLSHSPEVERWLAMSRNY